ncbi:hypothetical protein A1332_12790 [Methylomonas methanica]|uniref:Uncharacterized protein n=2 Tax=Methylomonas methanica TaxID=421 RepID=A0A177MJL0_METMH|nr:hypothetical protein A1332_12790 [Methylomonas methanica]
MKHDWKFVLTLLFSVAGVGVPVLLWQADQSSKSLTIQLETMISLQPGGQDVIAGIEISADGVYLEHPHLVVFEIRNDGSKPIPAADFESPVSIQLVSETTVARANVSGKEPKDIEATLLNERQGITLKPTLLNPGDTISVTVITSGAPPIFESKARIVGISNVVLEDGAEKKPNRIKLTLLLFGSILSFVSSSLMSDFMVEPKGIFLRRRAAAFVGIVAVFPGVIALQMFLERIEVQGFWYQILSYLILMIPVGFIARALNRSEHANALSK